MFGKIKLAISVAILAFVGISLISNSGSSSAGGVDLGDVLDRTEFAINSYDGYLSENGVESAEDSQITEFSAYLTSIFNSDPGVHDTTVGLKVLEDAKMLGFEDRNADMIQDSGESDVFTVEIDEANQRLIATDISGNSTGLRFSGSGFLAGALVGTLLGRQRNAGISAGSFNDRSVTPRSSYRSPRSGARSGGLRAGK